MSCRRIADELRIIDHIAIAFEHSVGSQIQRFNGCVGNFSLSHKTGLRHEFSFTILPADPMTAKCSG